MGNNRIALEQCGQQSTKFSLLEYIPYSKEYIKDDYGEILILEKEDDIEEGVVAVEEARSRASGGKEKKSNDVKNFEQERTYHHYHHSMSSATPTVPLGMSIETQKRHTKSTESTVRILSPSAAPFTSTSS